MQPNPSTENGSKLAERQRLLNTGFRLELFTIAWNIVEGLVAVIAGLLARSVALIGFGVDSFIETASALVVAWRLYKELRIGSGADAERAERLAKRIAGILLCLLAVYVTFDAVRRLLGFGEHPGKTLLGMILTAIALVVMFVLARAKLRIASEINSAALRADAVETGCCAWLALTTLLGLLLNALFGWWWADPIAALVLVPMIMREGIEALKAEECGCHTECK